MSALSRIRVVVPLSGWLLMASLVACGVRDLGIWSGLAGALMVVFSLATHELAHISAATALDVPVHEAGLKFIGAYTRRQRAKNRMHEVAISAAGPFATLLLFLVLFFIPKIGAWLSAWNLGILLLNLVPFPGTDGYRILKEMFRQAHSTARPLMIEADIPSARREALN